MDALFYTKERKLDQTEDWQSEGKLNEIWRYEGKSKMEDQKKESRENCWRLGESTIEEEAEKKKAKTEDRKKQKRNRVKKHLEHGKELGEKARRKGVGAVNLREINENCLKMEKKKLKISKKKGTGRRTEGGREESRDRRKGKDLRYKCN